MYDEAIKINPADDVAYYNKGPNFFLIIGLSFDEYPIVKKLLRCMIKLSEYILYMQLTKI